jgi:hypothetical protein
LRVNAAQEMVSAGLVEFEDKGVVGIHGAGAKQRRFADDRARLLVAVDPGQDGRENLFAIVAGAGILQ